MHKTLIPLATFAVLSLVGTAAAQEAAQTSSGSSAANAADVEALTCDDLNEMEPAEATAFLRGYQYGRTAADRTDASAGTTATASENNKAEASSTQSASSSDSTAAAGVGAAAATGDVGQSGVEAGVTDVGSQAILNSCFDAPSTPLDEVLGADFGSVN